MFIHAFVLDAKYNELTRKINQAKGERSLYSSNVEAQKHVSQRMREIRTCIAEADMLDKFDRVVFESIVEKIIVGDINEDGTVDPYNLPKCPFEKEKAIREALEHFCMILLKIGYIVVL